MPPLTTAVENYFADLRRIRASGGATAETSRYTALVNLLNAVGGSLKPKVFCIGQLANVGAGHPDFGLYAAKQVQRGTPREGQLPEHGVVEVKPVDDDAWLTAEGQQVSRYWGRYRLVLVTNYRDFVLVGEDAAGMPAKLETFRLADDAEDFDRKLEKPRAFANQVGAGLIEYLLRVLKHRAVLAEPRDLAWLLASYARDGLARVEAAGDAPSLAAVRGALEEALGVKFEGNRGAAFFRSTLVQTLFYGVFSAWVLWARQATPTDRFIWREAVWHLRAPVLQALFQQLSNPRQLRPLGLVEVLDWTNAALDRVDQAAFFARFNEGEAVPYFYEPFLQEFDPALRKQLGVWYTPAEVVRYMVARVDRALRDDLGIADGLAAENVYVLDPCCGTGAYLAEVLRRIAANLQDRGLGALTGARVKQAALERVFGFEIMPAPFVVAHLQVGLTMQDLDAPLAEDGDERAGVFLTNALTGWEPTVQKPLPFPELEEERDRAERVKQDTPILVILGNPPYNGFAGMAVDEERALSEAYRTTRRVRRPEGQGLNDLYVRFFRMAERRIAEKTGQGVVCFISNYSWLDGLSFTGMRERYLEAFDVIRIDNLHGDRIISEYSPDGRTSETVMAIQGQSPGIKVGTAIALLSKSGSAGLLPVDRQIRYRDFHQARAEERRHEMLESLDGPEIDSGYKRLDPELRLSLPFKPMAVSPDWFNWPALPELFPKYFPGVQTKRDTFLVDVDASPLRARIAEYFNVDISDEEIARRYSRVMTDTARFDAHEVRETLLERGGPDESGFVRHAYRPFDTRWLYWERETRLLGEKSPDYKPHVFTGNLWLVTQRKPRRDWSPPQVISHIGCLDLIDRGATCVPAWLREDSLGIDPSDARRPNLSPDARRYLEQLGLTVEDLFHHVLAVLHDPAYREANAGALRMEWPRIPLPGWSELSVSPAATSVIPVKTGIQGPQRPLPEDWIPASAGMTEGRASAGNQASSQTASGQAESAASAFAEQAARTLAASAARGRELAALLDSDTPVPGVTTGQLRPEIAAIAVPATTHGGNMTGDDFAVTAGWGHFGNNQAVMPGQGRTAERAFTPAEREALSAPSPSMGEGWGEGNSGTPTPESPTGFQVNPGTTDRSSSLGDTTCDIYLNNRAYWRNVPAAVWSYKLGGYQVLKKWLSYREQTILDRPLHLEDVRHFTDTARRIGAILSLTNTTERWDPS